MGDEVDIWLRNGPDAIMRKAGLREGHRVVDLGCGEGRYTIPAARIVGKTGRVFAVDKDDQRLREIKRRAGKEGLGNIDTIHVSQYGRVPVRTGTIDVVVLFDVLHGGYFPEKKQRDNLLRQIYRFLRTGGLLSCYLTHLREYGWTFNEMQTEIEYAGFRLLRRTRTRLVHAKKLVEGRIFRFEKPVESGKRKRKC